jgi:glycosyltransferase involved in cell wall biosynthesis
MKIKGKVVWVLHGPYRNEGRVYKESQTLSKNGYQVTILATWEKGLPIYENEGTVKVHRLSLPILAQLKIPLYRARFFMPFYSLKVLREIWKIRPDILHCMNFWTLHLGYLASLLFRVPFIYDSHDLFIDQNHMQGQPAWVKSILMKLEGFWGRRAKMVFQTTFSRSEQFFKYYGINARVLMNKAQLPINADFQWEKETVQKLATEKLKLVYVGSIQPERGLEQWLEAVEGLEGIQCYALGSPNGDWGRNFIKKNQKKLVWLSAVKPENITEALKSFDLGISLVQNSCLSYYYSCPTKTWELIACGVPQIASDFPEIRKIIIENKWGAIGQVVAPNDIQQIRGSIVSILSKPELLRHYRENCHRLKEESNWENESRKLLSYYQEALGK